jgi:4-diphosphocytidyl-2-C-methyl-D-erythritol kinase
VSQGAAGDSPPPLADPLRSAFAAAKVNLTLEVKGKRSDSYHELVGLVCFADFGDTLEFRPGDQPFSLSVEGSFADALTGGVNLVERAASAFASAFGVPASDSFRLVKRIPVAAGLGGGSADAAAALRLLAEHHGEPGELAELIPLARSLGADVPCCLFSRAALMSGVGDRLQLLPAVEPIPALLLNPMLPLATREVFGALAAGPLGQMPEPAPLPPLRSAAEILAYAAASANDLEAPACRLLPVIGDMLSALRVLPGALLVRLSGSGPTCFALFAEFDEAQHAAERVRRERPQWWVQPVMLS